MIFTCGNVKGNIGESSLFRMNLILGNSQRVAKCHYSTAFYFKDLLKKKHNVKISSFELGTWFYGNRLQLQECILITLETNAILDEHLNKKPGRARGS